MPWMSSLPQCGLVLAAEEKVEEKVVIRFVVVKNKKTARHMAWRGGKSGMKNSSSWLYNMVSKKMQKNRMLWLFSLQKEHILLILFSVHFIQRGCSGLEKIRVHKRHVVKKVKVHTTCKKLVLCLPAWSLLREQRDVKVKMKKVYINERVIQQFCKCTTGRKKDDTSTKYTKKLTQM